ncbi:hypothetical protein MPSEU_000199700 [Mayamaea pseudoterrestris]|nr:hypothetical protein MPSEU_000199700 [Mayamaea pseudoterrestris]
MPSTTERRYNTLTLLLEQYAFAIGLIVRILIAWLGPLLLDDGTFIPGVSYTDIDYHVFSDAANFVRNDQSPYDRHTYRYTPLLAMLLARLPPGNAGRYLFCMADAICGWMIVKLRQMQRLLAKESSITTSSSNKRAAQTHSPVLLSDALWWLYNPFAINICTRGSAESLLVLLPVLSTLYILVQWKQQKHREHDHGAAAILAGVCHGIAIHTKLYPIIYSVTFAICLVPKVHQETTREISSFFSQPWLRTFRLVRQPRVWMFAATTLATFGSLTYVSFHYYGPVAIQESLLYHLTRTDHRHNYSMHWYSIYLAQASNVSLSGLVYFVPQVLVLALVSVSFADHVELALFLETLVFVTMNKVITAQYFTWYLCLLPLCSSQIDWRSRTLQRSLLLWIMSMLAWLFSAYQLEMMGRACHRYVWLASVLYFVANVNLLRSMLRSLQPRMRRRDMSKDD